MADETHVALVALGPDRPGIVAAATRVLKDRGANIEDSRAAVLGGEFGLMLLASLDDGNSPDVAELTQALNHATGLQFIVVPTVSPEEHRKALALPYRIEANTLDHEGIVNAITEALYEAGVNIISLETTVANAPVTGTPIFSFVATVDVPAGLPVEAFRSALADAARRHNLDLEAHAI
jgi:glycine cleavage system transcriptional repressor